MWSLFQFAQYAAVNQYLAVSLSHQFVWPMSRRYLVPGLSRPSSGKVVPLGLPLAGLHSEMLWSQHDILGKLYFYCFVKGFPLNVFHAPSEVCMANMGDSNAVWLLWFRCHQTNGRKGKERKGRDRTGRKTVRSLGGGSGKPRGIVGIHGVSRLRIAL